MNCTKPLDRKVTYAKCLVTMCTLHCFWTIMLQEISTDTAFGKHACISEHCEHLQTPPSSHVVQLQFGAGLCDRKLKGRVNITRR